MTPKYGNPDLVQFDIVQDLRATGCSVAILTAVGGGFPDLLSARNGVNVLMELKTDNKKLNPDQIEWQDEWKAPIYIISCNSWKRSSAVGIDLPVL